MLSWPAPLLPTLPGTGPVLKVHDTARGEVVATSPDPTARMYVCGITPYDATHLGHAATYLAFDLVNRVWRDAGHAVHYVQNVTDIDDPLLERADRDHEDWIVLGMRETALFREDMTALRVLPPEDYVGAVESIPRIVAHIETLLDEGLAYVLDDGTGDIYHDVSQAPGFGGESGYDEATMLRLLRRARGRPRPARASGSRSTRCCGAARAPASRPGRARGAPPAGPGWHIECATIALDTIGMGFDVQGGGSDLVFPHHEYSAVHAEALTATKPFARAYVHAAMIGLDGEKMSKSRGNLVFVSRLRGEGVDPMAIRLALLSGHYRTDRAWTADLLSAAEERLATWRRAVAPRRRGARPPGAAPACASGSPTTSTAPGAIALVDAWAARDPGRRAADAEEEAPRDRRATPSTRCSASRCSGLRMTTAQRCRSGSPTGPPARRPRSSSRRRRPAPRATRGRARPEPEDPLRTAFERDRDRILHAKAFRRLKHKTQVFLNPDGDHFVTRLTHTLQVTQVARSLARALGLNETLAEAIALGHDVGHSPFGHLGEDALEPYVAGGWHHAAQGVRIVEVLEHLNLTWEVRDGIRAHSWKIDPPPATREARVRALRRPDRLPLPRRAGRHPGRRAAARRPARPGPRASSASRAARWSAR